MDASRKTVISETYIFTANLVVTDSTPLTVASPSNSFGYNAQPQVTISGSNTFLSSGQIQTYTINVIQGTGPFTVELFNVTGNVARDKCNNIERRNKYNNIH